MNTMTMTARRYSRGAIAFHWIIALLIVLNVAAALISERLPKAEAVQVMGNHKAIGITILLLSLGRFAWRLTHRPPPFVATLKPWEAALARTVHSLFYILMIAIPLTGWLTHSAFSGGKPIGVLGLFSYPGLPLMQDRGLGETLGGVHEVLAFGMLALLALHVTGALKHQFFDRDGTLGRMLPFPSLRQ